MKSTINFYKESKQNNNQEDNDAFDKNNTFHKSSSIFQKCEPLYNIDTFSKDCHIVETYGKEFLGFFQGGCGNTLPMITYPPTPRSVKKIIVDESIFVQSGNSVYAKISPFSPLLLHYVKNSEYASRELTEEVSCFEKYRVVCAKAMIKQVGIMHLSDGYGTVIDGVMVASNLSFDYLTRNLLSVQTGPGRKIMLVDGREGVAANFIGSPFFEWSYTDPKRIRPDTIFVSPGLVPCEIPAGAVVVGLSEDARISTKKESEAHNVYNAFNLLTDDIDAIQGTIVTEIPQGDSLFVRISPPSINVTIKIYVELVVEGIVKKEHQSNMPQVMPPHPFDYQRLFFALSNTIRALSKVDDTSFCATKKISYLPKPSLPVHNSPKGSPKINFSPKRVWKSNKPIVPKPTIENLYIDEPKCFLFNDDIEDMRCLKRVKKDCRNCVENFLRKHSIDLDDEEKERQIDDMVEKHINEMKKVEDDVSHCSDKPKEVKRYISKIQIKRISKMENPIHLPDYVKEAAKYSGLVVTSTKTTDSNNRLFQDASKTLPYASFQYFPAISEKKKEVYPAIVVVKQGIHESTVLEWTLSTLSDKERKLRIAYDKKQFTDPAEFEKALDDIVSYIYAENFHRFPDEGLSIRFFGRGKFADTSYMYALMAALYGGPSGGYYTGSFTFNDKENTFLINKIDPEVLAAKIKSATPNSPLMILNDTDKDGVPLSIISGITPSYNDGLCMITNTLFQAALYTLIPFSIRTVSKTPLDSLNVDCRKYVAEIESSYPVKFIALSNVNSIPAAQNLIKDGLTYKAASRAQPDKYTNFTVRSGKIISADEFYADYPELLKALSKPWKFFFEDHLFIEIPTFKADVRKMNYTKGVPNTEENLIKAERINKRPLSINEKDYKALKEKIFEMLGDIKDEVKMSLLEMEQGKQVPMASEGLFDEGIVLFEPIKKILQGVLHFVKKNRGSQSTGQKNMTKDETMCRVFGSVGIKNLINRKTEPTNCRHFAMLKKLVSEIGPGAVVVAAHLTGFAKSNPQYLSNKNVKKAINAFKEVAKNYSDIKNEQDEIMDKIVKKTDQRKEAVKAEIKEEESVRNTIKEEKKSEESEDEKEEEKKESSQPKKKKRKVTNKKAKGGKERASVQVPASEYSEFLSDSDDDKDDSSDEEP